MSFDRLSHILKYRFQGYTLIFAIVVVIIVTTFALLFLSYFNLNYVLLNRAKKNSIGLLYCYQGLACLNENTEYDQPYQLELQDGFTINLLKRKWGAYDQYYATVTKASGDTVCSKISLIGYQKDSAMTVSVLLKQTNIPLTIGDSVVIYGKCYVPSGYVKSTKKGNNGLRPDQLATSPDTLNNLNNLSTLLGWIRENSIFKTRSIVYAADTTKISFYHSTEVLSADTVVISGCLAGNVIVCAKRVTITATASVENIIIIAGSITFPDNFEGNLQAFAYDSICAGKNVTLNYPSILALIPAINPLPGNPQASQYIRVADSFSICGEIYAYAANINLAHQTTLYFEHGTNVMGSVYSSGPVKWEGNCTGSIICEKIFSTTNQILQANVMRNTQIDTIPFAYSYCSLFPFLGQKKAVAWLK